MFLEMDVWKPQRSQTAVWSKVRFINSCSIYRLAVLPVTVETINDILATSLLIPLHPLFPSPTPPLLCLPFLLAIFFLSLLSHFFFTWLLSLFFFVCKSPLCASFKCRRTDLPTFSMSWMKGCCSC